MNNVCSLLPFYGYTGSVVTEIGLNKFEERSDPHQDLRSDVMIRDNDLHFLQVS